MAEPSVKGERDSLTESVIGLAIEVHRALGPGLLESAYHDRQGFTIIGDDAGTVAYCSTGITHAINNFHDRIVVTLDGPEKIGFVWFTHFPATIGLIQHARPSVVLVTHR